MTEGLIFDIRRFGVHDGPGIRTTVFFKGCPMHCWWCHNPESQDFRCEESVRNLVLSGGRFKRSEITGKFMTADEVLREVERDRIFYDESGGGVTFSGGEPLMQETFLLELIMECRKKGIHTAIDTAGYSTIQTMQRIADHTDLFLYDLKLMDDSLHYHYTGVSNKPVLENLIYLSETGRKVILRFPVIPGITDLPENILAIKEFLLTVRNGIEIFAGIDLLPYHSIAREKYRRFGKSNKLDGLPNPTQNDLLGLKKEFEALGLKVKIGG